MGSREKRVKIRAYPGFVKLLGMEESVVPALWWVPHTSCPCSGSRRRQPYGVPS
jgi:hypothetical protein